jgi:Fic family protein
MDHNQKSEINTQVLKDGLEALRTIKPEDWQRLWRKFRLEWNYNSNHIEGNTLTYGETELLLIFEKTTGDHNKREYDEMQAHDVAIKMVQELADDNERPLTESFIRTLNEMILVKPYWKEAITPDGQNTRREIKIGVYKSFPNSVRLQNGEMFHYAKPEETAAFMNDLMKWYNDNIELNPVELAAQLHYRFVRIHPFDDGNGRVARLLMNYVLLKAGYPPVIIKSKDKPNYLTALNKADTGDINAFIKYIAEQLVWSSELTITAAMGGSVDELGDFDKRLNLIDRKLTKKINVVERSNQLMLEVYEKAFVRMIKLIDSRMEKLSYLFDEIEYAIPSGNFAMLPVPELHYGTLYTHVNELGRDIANGNIKRNSIYLTLNKFKKVKEKFDVWVGLSITFNAYDYEITSEISEISPTRRFLNRPETSIDIGCWNYLEDVSNTLLEEKAEQIANRVMDIIESKIKDSV